MAQNPSTPLTPSPATNILQPYHYPPLGSPVPNCYYYHPSYHASPSGRTPLLQYSLANDENERPLCPETPVRSSQCTVTPAQSRKRKQHEHFLPLTPTASKRTRRTSTDKLTSFELLDSFNWTLGELLYNIFRLTDEKGDVTHRSLQYAISVSHFSKGRSTYGVGMVLEAWFRSSDGAQVADTQESLQMYGMAVQYKDIRAARPALTSFAAQLVKAELIREAERAVNISSGLHTSTSKSSDSRQSHDRDSAQLRWTDIGSTTVESVAEVIRT